MPVTINGDGSITGFVAQTANIANGAIGTNQLANGAATQAKRTYAAGEVVQTVFFDYLNNDTNLVTSINSTSYTDVGVNIDITPKFANSKLIFETDLNCKLDDDDGHSIWDVYDATNSRYFSSNDGGAAAHYRTPTNEYISFHIRIKGAALNTNAMQLRLRCLVRSGGSVNTSWSSDSRFASVTEIAA